MAKQLLIYQSTVPLSFASHGNMSLDVAENYAFSAGINAVPLMAVEVPRAATEYAIVFTVTETDVVPAAVLGIRNEQNLYLSSDSQWQAKYIPAFIRRYPFVFSANPDGKTLTLCIDETHPGVNREGRGKRLFGADGKPSDFTDQVLKFLKEYQTQFERTRLFGRHLKDLGLLDGMQVEVTTPTGEKLKLSGFQAVSREKLRSLDAEALASLARTDELELIYLHLNSMRNFSEVKDRLLNSLVPTEAATA